MKKEIYYWACDDSENTGEGILANLFLKNINNYYKNYKLINIRKKKNIFFNYGKNYSNFFYKYITPFIGLVYIWKYSINKKKTVYINYLPLWNFLLITLLPQKTILGPITGTIMPRKYQFFLNIFKKISIKIILIKYNKILLATDFFKPYFKKQKFKVYSNFILHNFKNKSKNKSKEFDFVFYYRNYPTKGNEFIKNLVLNLSQLKFKIAIIGDQKIHNKYIINP